MKRKHSFVVIFLVLVISVMCCSRHVRQNTQSRFFETIRINTENAVLVIVRNMDDGYVSTLESNNAASKIKKVLLETTVASTTPKKYAYLGDIIFHDIENNSFKIDCFAHNIIRVDGFYYTISHDLLEMAKITCEADKEPEEIGSSK